MKFRFGVITLFLIWITSSHGTEPVVKVTLDEVDFLLLDVVIERQTIAVSVDAYRHNDRIVIAIESLFDSLKLRYQLTEKQLKIWKDDKIHIFDLIEPPPTDKSIIDDASPVWATDGYYQFVDLILLENLFDIDVEVDFSRQVITLKSDTNELKEINNPVYLFPVQKLALQSERRQLSRSYNTSASYEQVNHAITIADQYSFITPPSGRVNVAANLADKSFNGSLQLVSDFLYHSANLTLSQSDNSDLAASLSLSRYKSSPDDRILGMFDSYRLGDVSGVANNLTTGSNSGIGIVFQRSPDNFRRNNLQATLDELAPPGWDAELFRNGVFLDRRIVPNDGRLIYEDVEVFYGLNDFEIRLYGPFGEEDFITNRINVKQNALGKGQMAYSINALDKNHRLFNDDNESPYQITNFGGSFSIGITDRWQTGFSFASIDSEQQFISIKNALSFNDLLFENDLSINQDGSYAQKSSFTGSLFDKDNYTLVFESAKDFVSDTISAQNDDYTSLTASYSLPTYYGLARFGAGAQKTDNSELHFLSNQLSTRAGIFNLTNNLRYSKFKILTPDSMPINRDSILGNLSVSASIPRFSVSATLNYDPEKSDPILKSSSIKARKTLTDPMDNNHYIQAQYFPLSDASRRWAISHSIGWLSEDYLFTYSSSYDSNDNWAVNLGLRFYLGYDHRNNRFIMDKEFSGGSATLDVHTYLDRQVNGVPDVLDYNLPDVTFTGNRRWSEFRSNKEGRTILPGVYANSEFAFSGKWQEGSATYNQDYVVYTHPGAYVDVNMPFYLITDLTGFVVRQQSGQEIGLRTVQVQLLDAENKVQQTTETDQDGYYEFLNLRPNIYTVRVAKDYLLDKGFTGSIVGINVTTSGKGGYVELPTLVLQRVSADGENDEEGFTRYILNEESVDALVWDKDKTIDRNYFTLPKKSKTELEAKYSLTQANPQKQAKLTEDTRPEIRPSTVNEMPDTASPNLQQTLKSERGLTPHSVLQKIVDAKARLPTIKLTRPNITKPATEVDRVKGGNISPMISEESLAVPQPSWVIQFSANINPINKILEVDKYSKIGFLYEAKKVSSDDVTYHCVISQRFDTKQSAIDSLKISGLSGWVTNASSFSNAIKIN